MGGVETVGTRETAVIEAGVIGNNSPIQATREYWYADTLGVNLISKRQDPRFGTQTFEMTEIVLSESDAKLFTAPAGFKVIDLRNTEAITAPTAPSH